MAFKYFRWRQLGALALISLIVAFPVYAARCPQGPVEVELATSSDISALSEAEFTQSLERICLAAQQAFDFLQTYELTPKRDIRIELVAHSLEHYGYLAFGSYDLGSEIISLMSLPAILELDNIPEMYGQAFDQVHYDGAIAHEIAHAVFHQNSPNARLSNAAQEYLAHVTQLAVLPEERRQSIIERAGVGAWESGDAISEVYMAMSPAKFAVKSYLHLTTSLEPAAFVTILLNNKWFYVYAP